MSTREDGLALAVAHVLLLPCLFQVPLVLLLPCLFQVPLEPFNLVYKAPDSTPEKKGRERERESKERQTNKRCLFQSTDGTSPASKCLAAAIHVVLMVMAYYSTRIETAGHLSTWIGLQLLAKQRMRMGEILNKLLPPDMVDLVLAQHFQQGNEPLPIKVTL